MERHAGGSLRLGLTGGIASGKTSAAKMFEALGSEVHDADCIARSLLAPGSPIIATIAERFGAEVLSPRGTEVDRPALRRLIFSDQTARRDLEEILHPLVFQRLGELADTASGAYSVLVIPLLVETGSMDFVDRIAVVDCQTDIQLARLRARDNLTRTEALAIIAVQAERERRLEVADFILHNDGSREALSEQVRRVHEQLIGSD